MADFEELKHEFRVAFNRLFMNMKGGEVEEVYRLLGVTMEALVNSRKNDLGHLHSHAFVRQATQLINYDNEPKASLPTAQRFSEMLTFFLSAFPLPENLNKKDAEAVLIEFIHKFIYFSSHLRTESLQSSGEVLFNIGALILVLPYSEIKEESKTRFMACLQSDFDRFIEGRKNE